MNDRNTRTIIQLIVFSNVFWGLVFLSTHLTADFPAQIDTFIQVFTPLAPTLKWAGLCIAGIVLVTAMVLGVFELKDWWNEKRVRADIHDAV